LTVQRRISARELNRATLARQWLLERHRAKPAEAVGVLAGIQAQHANSPYVALWSRVRGLAIADLEAALEDRSVVKATVMRSTLHLVAAKDFFAFDAASAESRVATWTPTATRAGLDIDELHEQLLAFCRTPRTVADMEAEIDRIAPNPDIARHMPAGVRRAAFRIAASGGGLVHVPPSGLWRSHGKPSYIDARVWLRRRTRPSPAKGLQVAVERYLTAYGPASVGDIGKWLGQARVTKVRAAVESLGDRVVKMRGTDDRDLIDLKGLPLPDGDRDAPVRFLARWDSVLIAYDVRDRIIAEAHRPAVIKKNGDFLPTFLVDGMVAGLWAVAVARGTATLTLTPFGKVAAKVRRDLETEANALVRFVEPEAKKHEVTWART
jgi:hypothetical protein